MKTKILITILAAFAFKFCEGQSYFTKYDSAKSNTETQYIVVQKKGTQYIIVQKKGTNPECFRDVVRHYHSKN